MHGAIHPVSQNPTVKPEDLSELRGSIALLSLHLYPLMPQDEFHAFISQIAIVDSCQTLLSPFPHSISPLPSPRP